MAEDAKRPETVRLEQLWGGDFGDAYVERNASSGDRRRDFWVDLMSQLAVGRVLEVGCNVGGNLRWIAEKVAPEQVYGIDINHKALRILHTELPDVNALYSPARELPFRDRWFDFVFTMGVLIHQPDSTLPLVMNEIVRCSRRYVFCGEYFSDEKTEVPYRGQEGALFKRDYGKIYRETFPELELRSQIFLSREQGWDDITCWLFEKRQ